MKKLMCLVLVLLMVLPFAVACADNQGDAADTTTPTPSGDVTTPVDGQDSTDTTDSKLTPNIPEGIKYEGYSFIVANDYADSTKYTTNAIRADAQTGEPINDALYERTLLIEDMFGITIVDEDIDLNPAMNVFASGEDLYAIYTPDLTDVMMAVNAGYSIDFNDIDTIDLDMPWWDQNAVSKLAINGSVYYTFSDFFITALDNSRATYFNKDLITDLSLENPYELVRNNQWTIDKMSQMAAVAYSDLDGGGKMDIQDRVGIVNNSTTFYEAMLTGCDAEIVKLNEDGVPYFCCFDDKEFFLNVYQTLLSTFGTDNRYLIAKTDDARNMFYAGNTLFMVDTLALASLARQQEINFGILPIVKWDEAQENYMHVSPNPHAIVVPNVTVDTDRTGVLLEALAYYSSPHYSDEALIPSYFENSLRYKSTTDVESADMLVIIHDNISYVNKIAGTALSDLIYAQFDAAVPDITSILKKFEKSQKTNLEKVLNALG